MNDRRGGYYYEAIDPFKVSVVYSVKKLFPGKKVAGEASRTGDVDDVASLPVTLKLEEHTTTPTQATHPPKGALCLHAVEEIPKQSSPAWVFIFAFLFDTIPRQIYLHLLFRLPYIYFTRISRIFEEAEMGISTIKLGILEEAQRRKKLLDQMTTGRAHSKPAAVSESYRNLAQSWAAFIDALVEEWKTLNIISALLLSAVLTIHQLDGAGTNPLTRLWALISMICALASLLYGCVYIIHFGRMKKMYKAVELAFEAKAVTAGAIWNMWIMMAMPGVWLGWSLICFTICIMSLVWSSGTTIPEPLSNERILFHQVFITAVLCWGALVYFYLILPTLRRYGASMEHEWQDRVRGWISAVEIDHHVKSNPNCRAPTLRNQRI